VSSDISMKRVLPKAFLRKSPVGGSGILPEVYNYSFIYCSGSAEGIPLGKSARRLTEL